jgi:predicted DNA-binding transcriptional regulator YafY
VKTSHDDKEAKIERVYRLLRQEGDWMKESEISEILKIPQRTLNNYLRALEAEGKVVKEGMSWRLGDLQPKVLRQLKLEPEQAMVLYLAIRLFVKQSDKRNVDAENVLSALAEILSADAQLGQDISNAANELAQRPFQEGYSDIFRAVMRAYIYRCPIRIVYHPYRGESFETVFRPYLLEPSAIGFSTYMIGLSSRLGTLRTYKIERILHAEVLYRERYEIPQDFAGLALLQNAWSIFYGEETIAVTLRFHPDVARRVQETFWHPSQQAVTEDPEKTGYVLLRFAVADTTDLKPWIRTWGANCEVLEPQSLRDELRGEARRFAELYGWNLGATRKRFSGIFGDES